MARSGKTRFGRAAAYALASLAIVLTAGCISFREPTPAPVPLASAHQSLPSDGRPIRRVVVPPFQDLNGSSRDAEQVRTALIRALGRSQRFELVPLGETELREVLPASTFETGVIPREALISSARRYRADGVLFGVLTHYKPYEPLVIGITVELAAASTGEVVWSASGLYDAGTQDVTEDVHNYHDTELAASGSLEGWRLILMSPSRFTDYACSRLAATLR